MKYPNILKQVGVGIRRHKLRIAIAAGVNGGVALAGGIIGGALSSHQKGKEEKYKMMHLLQCLKNCQTALVFTEAAVVAVVSAIIKGLWHREPMDMVVPLQCRKGDGNTTKRRKVVHRQKRHVIISKQGEEEGLLNVEELLNTTSREE